MTDLEFSDLSPRQRRAHRERRALRRAVVGVVLTIGLVAAGVFAAVQWNPVLDDTTLCPTDRPVAGEHILVLDATDAWSPVQAQVIRQEFRRIQRSIPRFARLALYTIGDEPGAGGGATEAAPFAPAIRLCNPGRPDDFAAFPVLGHLASHLLANPRAMQTRWESAFAERLDEVLESEAARAGAQTSPIMETVRWATLRAAEPALDDSSDTVSGGGRSGVEAAPGVVYLFSDLLQHSDAHSLYRVRDWSVEAGRALADLGRLGTHALEDFEIEVYFIERRGALAPAHYRRGALIALWDAFFEEQGARLTRVRRLEG